MGSERKSAYIDDKNKLMTAYHEVGFLDPMILLLFDFVGDRVVTHWRCCTLTARYRCTKSPVFLAVIL